MTFLPLGALVLAGIAYQLASALLLTRLGDDRGMPGPAPAVTILKPLHGDEPRLAANLATFCGQDYPGPVQIVCGVAEATDPALAVARTLPVTIVADPTRHGTNAKVSNLINMMAVAEHDVVVLSDSDMAVPRDWLARVVAALDAPGVGAVTCLYHGRGDAGFWSRLAAQGITTHFLPSVLVGLAFGLARPCMGSTIAVQRATLDRIGGFAAVADVLADDHAIGEAVRSLGLTVAVPRFTIAHGCSETSLQDVIRHELRWATTIRRLDPLGYIGSGLVNPLPFAAIATVVNPGYWPLLAAAFVARACVTGVAGKTGFGAYLRIPLRDFLTFGVFLGSFLVQSVDWRGSRLGIAHDGRIKG